MISYYRSLLICSLILNKPATTFLTLYLYDFFFCFVRGYKVTSCRLSLQNAFRYLFPSGRSSAHQSQSTAVASGVEHQGDGWLSTTSWEKGYCPGLGREREGLANGITIWLCQCQVGFSTSCCAIIFYAVFL